MEPPIIPLTSGDVRGATSDGVTCYLAIPFASAERWRAPSSPHAWSGLRCNPTELPCSFQPNLERVPALPGHSLVASEDCLNLNVFVPAQPNSGSSSAPLPILFYIHGGAGKFGTCHKCWVSALSGSDAASRLGCIVVACNYRLGALGFLAHPEIAAEDEQRAAAAIATTHPIDGTAEVAAADAAAGVAA